MNKPIPKFEDDVRITVEFELDGHEQVLTATVPDITINTEDVNIDWGGSLAHRNNERTTLTADLSQGYTITSKAKPVNKYSAKHSVTVNINNTTVEEIAAAAAALDIPQNARVMLSTGIEGTQVNFRWDKKHE